MRTVSLIWLLAMGQAAFAAGEDLYTNVPMYEKGALSYYVAGSVGDSGAGEWMVDTGSSYMTVNDETLTRLMAAGEARYLRDLTGVLANGTEIQVSIYAISRVQIGENCSLDQVEAAVFPGKARQILGLSALRKASPFVFSTDPPQLRLSNCALRPESPAGQPDLVAAGDP